MCIKLKNDIPVCQRTRRLSCSDNPSPMKSKYRRFVLLRRIFEPWQWKRRKKKNRFEQTSRTLERKISMRSTKDQLVKKDVLMPVKHNVFLWNLPDVEEMPSHDGETAEIAYIEWLRQHYWSIWSEANPQVYVETPLHPEKLTAWCALWAGGIIGPYFFKNDEGHNVTVKGDRYRAMINNFFIPELNNHDVQELWIQQDGATCHTARATIDLLKDTFGDRLISRFGPVNWPPRSCDLTPLDYFLWGYESHWSMRISHKRLTIWKTTFAVLLPIYGHKCWKKSSKIGRPDWITSEPAVAVLCQKSYLKCNATRLSFE
ncbi:uncharacterized protein TNCV_4459561 [Trichonephila clavipes]|nr:uncharacterized protein TNCV_4459561 [Trichonephila clavipes]